MYQDPRFPAAPSGCAPPGGGHLLPVPRTNTTADDFWNQQMQLLVAGEMARLRSQTDRETDEHPLLPIVDTSLGNREKILP